MNTKSSKKSVKKTDVKKPVHKKNKAGDEALIAKNIVTALENLKGQDIIKLDVRELTDVTEIMIIASGSSSQHVKSLADNAVLELKKAGYRSYGMEGQDTGEWVLVDFGCVLLHVMQPQIRQFYDLERLWSEPREISEADPE